MASKAISVTLGETEELAERHVRSGRYESIGDVVREGIRALDREEEAFNAMVRQKVQEALDDPRPSMTADEAFEWLEMRAEERRRNK